MHRGVPREIPVRHCAVEDVVGVGPAHDHPQREAEAFGDEGRDDVAEGPARHRETHLRAHLQPSVLDGAEVAEKEVHRLGEDAGEVDRVDGRHVVLLLECRVRRKRLDGGVHVIPPSLESKHVHVRPLHRCHLHFLETGELPEGVAADDPKGREGRARPDRCRPRVPCGGDEEGDDALPLLREMVQQLAQHLLAKVFEGKGRPVEQLRHVAPLPHLADGDDALFGEVDKALVEHAAELLPRDLIPDPADEQLLAQRRERQAFPQRDGLERNGFEILGKVQPPIPRVPPPDRLLKRRLVAAARAHETHSCVPASRNWEEATQGRWEEGA
mmetsp:Transcript_53103/g.126349  ORF Transcript_53103/g.126349 Transcript_53103/m.126349 type:complete len:328 (+) Transcript_53103:769-1752(+)